MPLLLLCLTLVFGSALPQDGLPQLRTWVDRHRPSRRTLDSESEATLRGLLAEVRVAREAHEGPTEAFDRTLLDLATLGWVPPHARGSSEPVPGREEISALGLAELQRLIERDRDGRLRASLLPLLNGEGRPDEDQQEVALEVLRGRYLPETTPSLLRLARSESPDLRRGALAALAGWPTPEIHLFFLGLLERTRGREPVVARHFLEAAEKLDPVALDGLLDALGSLYLSEDWREATRASALVRALDTQRAAPLLIEALSVWERRRAGGEGSRRISGEIVSELRRRSARSIGLDPAGWSLWWSGVQEGRIPLPETSGGDQGLSTAQFFGLRPFTDRVAFVVDRSGSMDTGYGTSGRTRYQEAVAQLEAFLRYSGVETEFSVVLVSDRAYRWRNRPTKASEKNLVAIRRWMLGKEPDGATHLYDGMKSALKLDSRGRLDVDRLDVDTVVVLCDGVTSEGPAWVDAFLAQNDREAELVFHCVQIGGSGDGTLERLAEGSGGDFVRVGG